MPTTKELTPLYAEDIHMLEGLEDKDVDQYLEDNPRLVSLFEIEIITIGDAYEQSKKIVEENDCERAREAFDYEMEVS